MFIILIQDGEEQGSFSLDKVNEMILSGAVNSSTKAKRIGAEELIELGEVSGLIFPMKKKKPPVLIKKKKPPPLDRRRVGKADLFGKMPNASKERNPSALLIRIVYVVFLLVLLVLLILSAFLWSENRELLSEREELKKSIGELDLHNEQLNDSKEVLGNRLELKDGTVDKLLSAVNSARIRLDSNDRKLKEANDEKNDLLTKLELANEKITQRRVQSNSESYSAKSVKDFVMEFYGSGNSLSRVNPMIFYGGYVNHFGAVKSRRQIESEQKEYERKWPSRIFVINDENVNVKRILDSNKWIVNTRFTFELKSDGAQVKGIRDGSLLVEQTLRGEYQINEINSKTVGVDKKVGENKTVRLNDGDSGFMKTKNGKCYVWNNKYRTNDIAHWSGAVDTSGYATGVGEITWSKSDDPNFKWSYFGKKVKGKLDGKITYKDEIKGGNGWGEYTNGVRSGSWSYNHSNGKRTTKSY